MKKEILFSSLRIIYFSKRRN